MIKRNNQSLAARGKTVVEPGDELIINTVAYYPTMDEYVQEVLIDKRHKWVNKTVEELQIPNNELIIMDIRGDEKIIPNGDTVIKEGDILLIFAGH